MADVDRAAIAAELAALLGKSTDPVDDAVTRAVDAAVEYVELTVELDDPLQATPLVDQGLIGFARAIYLDARARGTPGTAGDVDLVFAPEDLWRHWRHYFEHLRTRWGMA